MIDTCINCIHMAYQYDIDGDYVPRCILKDYEIEDEDTEYCSEFKEYPF